MTISSDNLLPSQLPLTLAAKLIGLPEETVRRRACSAGFTAGVVPLTWIEEARVHRQVTPTEYLNADRKLDGRRAANHRYNRKRAAR
jgi:hypothetical protein